MELDIEQIVAMAVAAIAEEEGEDVAALRVISFREIPKSSLERYIADRGIAYKKYQLGDDSRE